VTLEDRVRLMQAAAEALDFRPIVQTETRTLGVNGAPDVLNQHGPGTIVPFEADITYLRRENGDRSIRACIKGTWRRTDGELTDAPIDQRYDTEPDETWPDWLAGLAWYYHPEGHSLTEGDAT
jgi:hypothetical protein